MNTTIRTIIYAAAVVLATVSCQKSAEPVQPAEEGKETIDICVSGLMGEYTQVDGTKAELVNTVRVSWKGGETVYVYDGTQCLGTLKASLEGTEDRYALLSTDTDHTVNAPATGTTKLTLVYSPLLTEAPTVSEGAISISLANQNGTKAPFVAYATLDYTGTNITNAVVPFQFATSVIKVNCTGLKPGTAITSATLSNVNTACKLTLSGDKAPVVAGGTNGTITRTGDSYFAAGMINAEGEAVFQIAVPALETASDARVLTVEQGLYKFKDKKFTTNSLAAATSVNTVCQLVGPPVGALPGVFTVSDPDGTPNSGDEKQVYFSKGNLWADGDKVLHFEDAQWKSTPASDGSKDDSHVSHFTWSDKVPDAVGNFNSGSNLFCDEANKQSVDGSGKIYYALSITEWQYLFDTRTVNGGTKEGKSYQRATINSDATSVYGMILYPDNYTSQTDATSYTSTDWTTMEENGCVFLPAAGCRSSGNASNVINVGSGGFYWSSTYDDNGAYYVVFRSSEVSPDQHATRDFGHSVRLITECQ